VGATKVGRQADDNWLNRFARLHRRDFGDAADDLFTWELHRRFGLRVQASTRYLHAFTGPDRHDTDDADRRS
jgi:uncharacterized protein (UPF0548 family)